MTEKSSSAHSLEAVKMSAEAILGSSVAAKFKERPHGAHYNWRPPWRTMACVSCRRREKWESLTQRRK